ncbi:hypothetical protein [Pontibacter akesuensis]|uniref:Uncharacterized protein n=1 Tax=Pontibacter akesuensis TaxID=388950 RepID=A0A1I7JEW3_9BACT|nr:hypothetical protein [Pontibacter akesuensis]GHA70459.1 hypothetical protein GCM10007389_24750 [Pontibacter akesuensis]SFU83690.1 hypothetical protein SAMN04487941_2794 [Pontibacter akesuensis]
MKEEDKEEVLTGNTGEQGPANGSSDADVVRDENIPVILIDTTPQQEEQQ